VRGGEKSRGESRGGREGKRGGGGGGEAWSVDEMGGETAWVFWVRRRQWGMRKGRGGGRGKRGGGGGTVRVRRGGGEGGLNED